MIETMTPRFAKTLARHPFGFAFKGQPGELVRVYGHDFWKQPDGRLLPAMAGGVDVKISALGATAGIGLDAMEIPVNDAGTTKKMPLSPDLKAWVGSMIGNRSVADQTISAATAYVIGSNMAVPVGKLRVGTGFKWKIFMTKTAAGTTAGSTILLKIGTLGTTGDATIATLTTGTPTANVDVGCLDLRATIRTIGAAATSNFAGTLTHNLTATGFSTLATETYQAAGTTFDSTVANLIVGLVITTTTASAWTLVQVMAEAEGL
jgi:hypothetical protein